MPAHPHLLVSAHYVYTNYTHIARSLCACLYPHLQGAAPGKLNLNASEAAEVERAKLCTFRTQLGLGACESLTPKRPTTVPSRRPGGLSADLDDITFSNDISVHIEGSESSTVQVGGTHALDDNSQLEPSELPLAVSTSQEKSAPHRGIESKNGSSDVKLAVEAQVSAQHQGVDPMIGLSDIERAVASLNYLNDRYTSIFSTDVAVHGRSL